VQLLGGQARGAGGIAGADRQSEAAAIERGRVGGDDSGLGEVGVERGEGGPHPLAGAGAGADGVQGVQPGFDVAGSGAASCGSVAVAGPVSAPASSRRPMASTQPMGRPRA
jgi:hypothetical protein